MVAEEPDPLELVWYDIDLEQVPSYDVIWKPETLKWAKKVNWAKVNDLIRHNLAEFPANDPDLASGSLQRAGLRKTDRAGLFTLYLEPIFATPLQISNGGHRLTAMRGQGLRWALGTCHREDVGPSVDEFHAYLP
jgi:hypothetical protein